MEGGDKQTWLLQSDGITNFFCLCLVLIVFFSYVPVCCQLPVASFHVFCGTMYQVSGTMYHFVFLRGSVWFFLILVLMSDVRCQVSDVILVFG